MKARTFFWPCLVGLAALLSPSPHVSAEPPTDGETVAVPKDELARLYDTHKQMRARLETLEQTLNTMTERAAVCYTMNEWSGGKWR